MVPPRWSALQKKFPAPLETFLQLKYFAVAGCSMVRCGRRRMSDALLVSMLLNGGCGYEDFRLYSLLAVEHRLRLLVRSAEQSPADRRSRRIPALRYCSDRRRHLPHRGSNRRIYPRRDYGHEPTESPDGGRPQGKRG